MDEARDQLEHMLREDLLAGAPLLVLANKQDLPGAASASDVAGALGLHSLRGRPWHIEGTCALTRDGVFEGLEWLREQTAAPGPAARGAGPPGAAPGARAAEADA